MFNKETITAIARYTTNKEGQPLKTRDGRPYTSVRIKTTEHGDKWMSGFGNKDNESWKEGDTVEITVEQKGEYLNFTTPKKEDATNHKLEQILNSLAVVRLSLEFIKEAVLTDEKRRELADKSRGYHYPTAEEEGIKVEPEDGDVPF